MSTNQAPCVVCGETQFEDALVSAEMQVRHEGRLNTIHLTDAPVSVCGACGFETVDERYEKAVRRALRAALNYMQPEEVSRRREELGLRQSDVYAQTGITESTQSRIENDRIVHCQSVDKSLRMCFDEKEQIQWITVVDMADLQFVSINPGDIIVGSSNEVDIVIPPEVSAEPGFAMAA